MNRRVVRRPARGAATAELVVALPVLVAVTVLLTWFLTLGIAQVRIVDAARESARALARGDDSAAALARGREVGPAGTRLQVRSGSTSGSPGTGMVTVVARAVVHGPGGLFRLLPVTVRAEATAVQETSDAP
ncbi:TadE family type IV pilus minor pilin [Nocardioides sp.]|uniref:TadE family type IV pilus minor pilin n=1 Tax=Nocardioides sp. TaxID=35761 RepID=UPI00260A8D33|nr:TadE family type IV pilus minor pilin [Nocardioides sp.]